MLKRSLKNLALTDIVTVKEAAESFAEILDVLRELHDFGSFATFSDKRRWDRAVSKAAKILKEFDA